MLQDILKELAREQINLCKDSCYSPNGRNASNVSEGDYGDWEDWEKVLINFGKQIYNTARKELIEEILREMPERRQEERIEVSAMCYGFEWNQYRDNMLDLLNKKI